MAKSLKKNVALNLVRSIMSVLFPLVSFPYASRILLPSGIGNINFANSIIDIFLLISGLGIVTYGTREGSKIKDDQKKLNKFAREMFILNICSMAISLLLFFISLSFVDKFSEVRTLLLITSVKIVFESVGLSWVLFVMEDYKAITIRSILLQSISLGFLFIFVHEPSDIWKYAIMGIIYSVGANSFSLFYTRKYVNIFDKTTIELRKHFRRMFIFFGLAASAKLYAVVDSTMLGFLCTPEQVGFYSAANKLVNIVIMVISAALSVFLPRATYYYSNNNKKDYYALVRDAINTTVFYALPVSFGLFILCEPVIILINGKDFMEAIPSMKFLCVQILFTSLIMAIQNLLLVPRNEERVILISQNIAFAVNLIFNSILIKRYQAYGASIATSISQISLFLILFIYTRKHIFKKSFLMNLIQTLISSVAMFIVVKSSLQLVENRAMQLVVGVFSGVVVYASSSILLRNTVAIQLLKMINEKRYKAFHRIKIETLNSLPIKDAPKIEGIIISLTSYPQRLKNLHLVIRSLLHQSVQPEKIILYLGSDTKDSDIPTKLKKLQRYNFEIRTGFENLMPHKKYFFAMQEFPEKIIITVDDDAIYDKDLVKDLYDSFKKYPDCISARRVNMITKSKKGRLNYYSNWLWEYKCQLEPSFELLATGCGGILYPPGLLPKETFDTEAIRKYCLQTDDIWLKFMELKNNVKVVFTNSKFSHPLPLRHTQESGLLQTNTKGENRNDLNIAAMENFTGIKLVDYIAEPSKPKLETDLD